MKISGTYSGHEAGVGYRGSRVDCQCGQPSAVEACYPRVATRKYAAKDLELGIFYQGIESMGHIR